MRPLTQITLTLIALSVLCAVASSQPPPYEVRTYVTAHGRDSNQDGTPDDNDGDGLPDYYIMRNPGMYGSTGPDVVVGDPSPSEENTLKEPYVCPYCGYSTGGTYDWRDLDATAGPDGDVNQDGIPDEAQDATPSGLGTCPDPWELDGHPASLALERIPLQDRFFSFRWLSGILSLVRGLPFRPGDQNIDVTGTQIPNELSQVHAAFAVDDTSANNARGFGDDPTTDPVTQVRLLLLPPGIARPTARYHSFWEEAQDNDEADVDNDSVADSPWEDLERVDSGNLVLRVGVNPWSAVDGDEYQVRLRHLQATDTTADIQVWSDANGLEYNGTVNMTVGSPWIWCNSGAVRIDIDLAALPTPWTDPLAGSTSNTYPDYCAFGFTICNNARTIPHLDYQNVWQDYNGDGDDDNIDWESDQTLPDWDEAFDGEPYDDNGTPGDPTDDEIEQDRPQNYFTIHDPVTDDIGTDEIMPGTGVKSTDRVGDDPVAGPILDFTGQDYAFRLRPGETGTGMVSLLWRDTVVNPTGNVTPWNYDEDSNTLGAVPNAGTAWATTGHENGVQPIAARFFCSRVDTHAAGDDDDLFPVTIDAGTPGGATETSLTGIVVRNRQVGEVIRCPVHVSNEEGRWQPGTSGSPVYMDPEAGVAGDIGVGPGGDAQAAQNHDLDGDGTNDRPDVARTLGCGAVHFVASTGGTPVECWCGRIHDAAVANVNSMYCNYCGTRLLGRGWTNNALENNADIERAEARVSVAGTSGSTSHNAADPTRPDGIYTLPTESVRGSADGVYAPGGKPNTGSTPADISTTVNPLFVSIPAFQLPSYEPGTGDHEHGADSPYYGALIAHRVSDREHRWYEDQVTGEHAPYRIRTGDQTEDPLFDGDGEWDIFYRCPDCGNKHPAKALVDPALAGSTYAYSDTYGMMTVEDTDLQCSHGRAVGARMLNDSAYECPGHQVCQGCGAAWEALGEANGPTDEANIWLAQCPFCGGDLYDESVIDLGDPDVRCVDLWAEQSRFIGDFLAAEEFDPFMLEASVLRKTRLAAQQKTVDLGRVAPGSEGSYNFPTDTSPVAVAETGNESNYNTAANVPIQGVQSANTRGADARTVTTQFTAGDYAEIMRLLRDDVSDDPAIDISTDDSGSFQVASDHRLARTLPLTLESLFSSNPVGGPADQDWLTGIASPVGGSDGARPAIGLLQAGVAGTPVPNAIGSGSYSGATMAFVDTMVNGYLDFLDRSENMRQVTSQTRPFDPNEDYALEPVIPLNLRMRVVETRMYQSARDDLDASPAPLILDTNLDGLDDRIDVLWETARGGGAVDSPVNIRRTWTDTLGETGVARHFRWPAGNRGNMTNEQTARVVHGSPEAYIDPYAGRMWAMWHRVGPTELGFTSTLWSATGAVGGGPGAPAQIFDSGLDKTWIRALVDPTQSASRNRHWSFWNSGRRGRWEIHYSPQFYPSDPDTVEDLVLPVSNGAPATMKHDYVPGVAVPVAGGVTATAVVRKPSKSPFTYVKDPAPVLERAMGGGDSWVLHTFFSGYIPHERNADICYVRFDFDAAAIQSEAANFGKIPHQRITAPAGGEQMRGNGMRQTFASRHLDWITTRVAWNDQAGPDYVVRPYWSTGNIEDSVDPLIYVRLVTEAGSTTRLVGYYDDTAGIWRNEGRYNRAKGTYRFTNLYLTDPDDRTDRYPSSTSPLTAPNSRQNLTMEVDPASGMVGFSAPLFNSTNPDDENCVFHRGLAGYADLTDVQVWASYTPYVYRLTRGDGNDDSPSAFYDYSDPYTTDFSSNPAAVPPDVDSHQERAGLGRFLVFWRRSHGAADAPHFGRTSFMYRSYSTAIQVRRPPIDGSEPVTVVDLESGETVDNYLSNSALPWQASAGWGGYGDLRAGIIGIKDTFYDDDTGYPILNPSTAGDIFQVTYTPTASSFAGNTVTEYHRVVGWSAEKRVNVDTVYSEGPLYVKKEWYRTETMTGDGADARQWLSRYWLFWTSPRAMYRPIDDTFYRSRDIYYATVVPESGTEVPRN